MISLFLMSVWKLLTMTVYSICFQVFVFGNFNIDWRWNIRYCMYNITKGRGEKMREAESVVSR